MKHAEQLTIISENNLTPDEKKRLGLASKSPMLQKLANISKMEAKGDISPIIRLEKVIYAIFNVLTVQLSITWIDIWKNLK